MIRDIDRVFAMLDGKAELEVSLESVLDRNLQELKREARLSGSYFDVRFYPGVGTIHFFPSKEKNLVDRLNRLVGKHRQWIPKQDDEVTKNFWQAYDKSEKLDAELRKGFCQSQPAPLGQQSVLRIVLQRRRRQHTGSSKHRECHRRGFGSQRHLAALSGHRAETTGATLACRMSDSVTTRRGNSSCCSASISNESPAPSNHIQERIFYAQA